MITRISRAEALERAVERAFNREITPRRPQLRHLRPDFSPHVEALQRAISIAGSQSALARRCGIPPHYVCRWLKPGYCGVGPHFVIAVEKAVDGQVTRHQLRPDLYPEEK